MMLRFFQFESKFPLHRRCSTRLFPAAQIASDKWNLRSVTQWLTNHIEVGWLTNLQQTLQEVGLKETGTDREDNGNGQMSRLLMYYNMNLLTWEYNVAMTHVGRWFFFSFHFSWWTAFLALQTTSKDTAVSGQMSSFFLILCPGWLIQNETHTHTSIKSGIWGMHGKVCVWLDWNLLRPWAAQQGSRSLQLRQARHRAGFKGRAWVCH